MKKCKMCEQIKQESEFYVKYDSRDRLSPYCKQCCSERNKQYRHKNHTEILLRQKRAYYQNRDKRLLGQKRYAQRNREKIRAYRKGQYDNPRTGKQYIKKQGDKRYWVYYGGRAVHDVIAEKILGRRLQKGEVVHHHDNNGLNNNYSNLLICTRGYHTSLHEKIKAQAIQ